MVNTKVIQGFMELTPDKQLEFDRIKTIISDEYKRFGFTPIVKLPNSRTPCLA